jgi:hypothetical protein
MILFHEFRPFSTPFVTYFQRVPVRRRKPFEDFFDKGQRGTYPIETVSQCDKSPRRHAERERSICFSDTLRKADSSPLAQNDIATQSHTGEEEIYSRRWLVDFELRKHS